MKPSLWVGLKPFGIGEQRPNNYAEIWRAIGENKDNLRYAARILKDGCCDGCALGTSGVHDWTLDGIHLCNIRLRLLRLNTMGALDENLLGDVSEFSRAKGADLRDLGRLPYPMLRRRGDAGFHRVSWEQAFNLMATRISESTPDRLAFYLTSRGMPNESYYAAQKAVRALGTNNIDNAARVCHSPSTTALKRSIGAAATTCSYTDWMKSEVIVFIGSNIANNQPVAMKYLYLAKKAGAKVVCINPYKEPGMERYWIPSSPESALFGTKIADDFIQINIGGDVAFLNGVLKHMIERGLVDDDYVRNHTHGFDELTTHLASLKWGDLEAISGAPREVMAKLGDQLGGVDRAILVWSMGITQHHFGEDNVQAIANLALSKGFLGRDGCGLMPIRGHSGVQGGAEMGAYSTALPGGVALEEINVERFSKLWGFEVPAEPGLTTTDMIDSAHGGGLDLMFSAGGNFLDVLPDPKHVHEALERVPLRVHMDIVLSSQMFVESDEVLLLPAKTRYEIEGGVTETSTERRVIFNPEIPGPRIGEARAEWEVFGELAARVRPELADRIHFSGTAAIRDEIAKAVPIYDGIQYLEKKGDSFQYGGPHLCADGNFGTASGRAHFAPVKVEDRRPPDGRFTVTTRRGKQFNSMVHETTDSFNGAVREAVLINPSDAARLGVKDGDAVLLRNDLGELRCRITEAPVQPGSLQVHWPEGQVLLDPSCRSPEAKIPDYNAAVEVVPVGPPG